MKKLFLLAAVLFSIPVFSQSADERIGTLINQSDWFGLEENYPILKDSMQVDFLKLMSEIMIDYNFNRPDKAIRGNYASAAQNAQSIIDQLKAQNAEKEAYEGLEQVFSFYSKLSSIPAPSITRPDCDVSVPIEIEKVKLPTSVEPKGYRCRNQFHVRTFCQRGRCTYVE